MLKHLVMIFLLILAQSLVSVVPNECAKRGYVYNSSDYEEHNLDTSNGPCTSRKRSNFFLTIHIHAHTHKQMIVRFCVKLRKSVNMYPSYLVQPKTCVIYISTMRTAELTSSKRKMKMERTRLDSASLKGTIAPHS